jgi:transposase
VLTLPPTARVYLAAGVTDMRKAYDTLASVTREVIGEDPLSGHLFVFCNRRHNRLKILVWDGSGFWIFAKRLEKGTFAWPDAKAGAKKIELTSAELNLILSGIDFRDAERRPWWRRRPGSKEIVSS